MPKNRVVDPIEIKLDRTRYLEFNNAAFLNAERKVNQFRSVEPEKWVPYWELAARLSGDSLQAFLWAGLLKEDPELTFEQAGELINFGNLRYVMGRIRAAIGAHLPDRSAKQSGDDLPLGPDGGSDSGPPHALN